MDNETKVVLEKILNRLDAMENRMNAMEEQVTTLRSEVMRGTVELENSVAKALNALSDGYKMLNDKFDRFDPDNINAKIDMTYSIAQLANDKVDRVIERLNNGEFTKSAS